MEEKCIDCEIIFFYSLPENKTHVIVNQDGKVFERICSCNKCVDD